MYFPKLFRGRDSLESLSRSVGRPLLPALATLIDRKLNDSIPRVCYSPHVGSFRVFFHVVNGQTLLMYDCRTLEYMWVRAERDNWYSRYGVEVLRFVQVVHLFATAEFCLLLFVLLPTLVLPPCFLVMVCAVRITISFRGLLCSCSFCFSFDVLRHFPRRLQPITVSAWHSPPSRILKYTLGLVMSCSVSRCCRKDH